MRKLAANLVALVSLGLFVLVCGASDCTGGGSPCERACVRYNKLGCATECDCTACDQAPDSCDTYFDCVANRAHTCPEFTHCFNTITNAECRDFAEAHCK
jgi:hypothetical protein